MNTEEILAGFYRPGSKKREEDTAEHGAPAVVPPAAVMPPAAQEVAEGDKKQKPTHYKIVCISLYNEDIARLESMVQELKRRGHTKANKSQLIRVALEQVDLDKVVLPTVTMRPAVQVPAVQVQVQVQVPPVQVLQVPQVSIKPAGGK